MQFLGKPTRRAEAQREELTPRPGSQRQEGCFWQEEREVLGPEMGQYLGTTAILYEPRGRVQAWQRWQKQGTHGQGLARRGQPAPSLLGQYLPPPAPPASRLSASFGRARGRLRTAAAALSSRPPGGSRAGRARGPLRRHQSPAPPARSGCGRGGRAGEGGRFRRIPL